MMEKEMLENAALENVSGGAKMSGYHFLGKVSPEACVVGQNYYVVSFDNWYYGQLEKVSPGNSGECILQFNATMYNGVRMKTTFKVNAASAEIYTKMAMDC